MTSTACCVDDHSSSTEVQFSKSETVGGSSSTIGKRKKPASETTREDERDEESKVKRARQPTRSKAAVDGEQPVLRRSGRNLQKPKAPTHGDDSMDEVLADLQPLRSATRTDRKSALNDGESTLTTSRRGGTGNSAMSTTLGAGQNEEEHANLPSQLPRRRRRTNAVASTALRRGETDVQRQTGIGDALGAGQNEEERANQPPVPRRSARDRRARCIRQHGESSTTNGRLVPPFPRVQSGNDRNGSGPSSRPNPVVITISDSENDDEDEGNGEDGNHAGVRGNDGQAPVCASSETNVTTSNAPSTDGDEEYARHLQMQLDREGQQEARARARRLFFLSNMLEDVNSNDNVVRNGTTTERPTSDSGTVEGSQNVNSELSNRSLHHSEGAAVSPLDSLVGSRIPRGPALVAFHRRPVPGSGSTRVGREVATRSTQASSSSTTTSDGNTQTRPGDSFLTLIDVTRMRRVWFNRAIRYRDFEQLESALLDLAQALGDALTDEQINRMPTSVFSSTSAGTSTSNCTICMEEFVDNEVQRHLPCSHTFHKNCVDVWLKQKSTCPICRMDARGKAAP